MKSHRTKEQRFEYSGLSESERAAFYLGWYAAGQEISQGEDYDSFDERLLENDFLPREDPEEKHDRKE